MKIKVSHILVKHQYEAEDLLKKLAQGSRFEDLARKYSTCASAKANGSLGEVLTNRLDEDFAEAAMALSQGETSGVVRSRFGYHLIRRDTY
jgi:peptidyl-prolyl cis-trans isomerase C